MHTGDTIIHIQQPIIRTKAHAKFLPGWLKIFGVKVKKVKNRIQKSSLLIRCASPSQSFE